jgi:hypothetical protein
MNFVPPLFLVYLAAAPFLVALTCCGKMWLLPLAFYGLAVLVQAAVLVAQGGLWRGLAASPLIVLTHLLYGYGFWRGLFTRLKPAGQRAPVAVGLERVTGA